jgi:putative ABC transport system permease protein
MTRLANWIQTLPLRLRSLFRGRLIDQELDEELRYHLESKAQEYIARGMSLDDARRTALIELGGVEQTKEACRDQRGMNWIEILVQDLRYGLRQLRRRPTFTTIAILTLALGVGANTAIFCVLNAVLLRPLPYESSSDLVWLTNYLPRLQDHIVGTPDFVTWRSQNHSLSKLAAFEEGDVNLTGGINPERIHSAYITASLFPLLEIRPELGRGLRDEENVPGAPPVVILSHGLWQRRFGASSSTVGSMLVLDGTPHEVVGVMPASFVFPNGGLAPDILVPLSLPEHLDMASKSIEIVSVIGRLRRGISINQAGADLSTIQQRFVTTYPPAFKNMAAGIETQVISLHEHLVGEVRHTLLLLLAAALFLLLVASVNTANLQLAKATSQSRELSVRLALGASRSRLTRQVLTESLLVTLCGGATGTLVTFLAIEFLHKLEPQDLPHFNKIGIDSWVLAFGFTIAILSGLISCLAPALLVSAGRLNDILKESSRTLTDVPAVRRVRNLLVVSEISLAMILLIGSGLFIRTFLALSHVNPGFDSHNLLTLRISLPEAKYPNIGAQRAFFEQLADQVKALPGNLRVGAVSQLPLDIENLSGSVVFEGQPTPPRGMRPSVPILTATTDYFPAMGIPVVLGRCFEPSDTPDTPGVVLVNQAFVRKFFSFEDPIGKRIQLGGGDSWMTVVGVVGDVRRLGLQTEPAPEVFNDFRQNPRLEMALVVRSAENSISLTSSVRQEVLSLDKEQPVFDIATMERRLAHSIASEKFKMWLLSSFGTVALVLAVIGIYGIVSFQVVQRTHEIGVRMALGAEYRDVLRLVIRRGAMLTLLGITIGTVAALVLTRFLSTMLFGVRPNDMTTFVAASVVLGAAAFLASYVPAHRATRVDPMAALRYE